MQSKNHMKKTISINLGSALFYAEDDAYARLDAYLREVEHYFNAKGDDGAEILRDIETSLAEKFSTTGAGDLHRAITLLEVEEALKGMGTVNDFSAEENIESPILPLNNEGPRRYYRDGDNAIIGGVCAGLGHYFGIDPVWVRLLFFLSLFLWGFGVVIYIMLWIAAPEAKTASDKLAMHGEAVNLSSLSAKLKENLQSDNLKKTGNDAVNSFSRFLKRFFNLIGRILRGFGPIFRFLFGTLFGLFALAGLCFFSVAGVMVIFSGREFIEPGLVSVMGWPYPWLALSLTFVFALPCLAAVLAAITMLWRKKWLPNIVWLLLLCAWFISVLAAAAFGSNVFTRVHPYVTENRTESISLHGEINSVSLNGPYYLSLVPAATSSLQVEGSPEGINRIEAVVANGELSIGTKSVDNHICINCGHSVHLILGVPTSTKMVTVDGGGVLNMEDWESTDMALEFHGNSGGNLGLKVNNLHLVTDDYVNLDFIGSDIKRFVAEIGGWSRVDTASSKINEAAVTMAGASELSIRAAEKLNVSFLPDSPKARVYYNSDLKTLEADKTVRRQILFLDRKQIDSAENMDVDSKDSTADDIYPDMIDDGEIDGE